MRALGTPLPTSELQAAGGGNTGGDAGGRDTGEGMQEEGMQGAGHRGGGRTKEINNQVKSILLTYRERAQTLAPRHRQVQMLEENTFTTHHKLLLSLPGTTDMFYERKKK